MEASGGWESRAGQWLAWARTPGHDVYWDYRDAFFALVPEPAGRTLEVGCGEGRVSRDLVARGHGVTALDPSETLIAAAAELDPESDYVLGYAEDLPFPDAAFGLVVSYNALMDVRDMPHAVREAARVLVPGGRLCLCVTHPLNDAGDWDGEADDARYTLTRSYLESEPFEVTIERDGLSMEFDGTTYSLEAYARALEAAGLQVEAIREPSPRAETTGARWARVPMFLMLRAVKA